MPTSPTAPKGRKTRDLRLFVRVRAKPAAVYHALTSARELCRWWLTGAETESRSGGRMRLVWPQRPGRRNIFGEREGCFVDLEPERKVAWIWKPARRKNLVPVLCSFFILPKRGGCEVTLLHAGFPVRTAADRVFAAFAEAWEDGLAKLKVYLETGKTCKHESLSFKSARALLRAKDARRSAI
ncbi:MAG: SRPBCC domain-containing protein [Elusimicrobia bacterium]|nr:SRPBCC domain-containing protein [Elusimicrobiota bacterium]